MPAVSQSRGKSPLLDPRGLAFCRSGQECREKRAAQPVSSPFQMTQRKCISEAPEAGFACGPGRNSEMSVP